MDPMVRPSLSADATAVYEAAVTLQAATTQQLAAHAGLDPAVSLAQVEALASLGLVEVSQGVIVPLAPRLPLERLAAEYAREADQARRAASTFADLWSTAAQRHSYLEVVDDEARAVAIEAEIMRDAVAAVDALCIGPVSPRRLPPGMEIPTPQVIAGLFEAIERGVRVRGVYGVGVLEDTLGLAAVQRCIAAGEEARVLHTVPLNLIVVDAKRAFCAVPGQGRARRSLIVIHESGLLDSMVRLVEVFWQMAVPLTTDARARGDTGPRPEERQLLAHLAAGMTDEAIARDLGISPRTLGRRIARLEEVLGAHSRFQLAVQASRHGWL